MSDPIRRPGQGGCPHGWGAPGDCSQCRQARGEMFVVKTVVARPTELVMADFGTIPLTHSKKRCTHCRKAGHLVGDCKALKAASEKQDRGAA